MERVVKHLFILLVLLINATAVPAYSAGEIMNLSTLITTQNVPFEHCTKVFNTDNNSLFYLTIAAINANRFDINEIQSASGIIIFTAVNKIFIANVSNVNTNQGMLKITPADGSYYFQPGICLNVFKYIDLNLNRKQEVIF